ncbi:MAG: DUF2024 family protein [Bacteroidetes bacterium]|nr:DUF2024 family protein [Bacteroidota bacterium]
MKVAVYDTYVRKKDGRIMHFDILVPSQMSNLESIYSYGKEYRTGKGQAGQPLSARECRFCHIEKATDEMKRQITEKGYYILEMEGC